MSTFPEPTSLSARRGESSSLAVLVDGVADPVDSRVVPNSRMHGINENDLEIFVSGILIDPVRVQDTHVSANPAGTLLSNTLHVSVEFELSNTLILGLSVYDPPMVGPLAATATHSNAIDSVSLFRFVAELVSLVGAGGV